MTTHLSRRAILSLCLLWAWSCFLHAEDPPKGQRIYSIGHSFHVFMPGLLAEIAKSAGIADHKQVGLSSIGGSNVIQHWNVADDAFKSKAILESGELDVLTMSPIFLPDEGIENYIRLASEKSPNIRVLVQELWLPFDANIDFKKEKVANPNRDEFNVKKLQEDHDNYFKSMDEHVKALNEKYAGKPRVFVAPVGQAVMALRKKIAAGEAPGLTKQMDLFTDPIGHAKPPLAILVAYCYYAQIYERTPVGLPVPAALTGVGDKETTAKLNKLLQDLAWTAVTEHPLSGVKAK
jgi:hypothetical protein